MKALSLQQPWANWVAEGKKTIETRKWRTEYRGEILIVSSKQPDIAPAGYALAVVTVVDCRPMTINDELAACCKVYPRAQAWILKDIRRIQPFPLKGSLGLYDIAVNKKDLVFV